MLKSLCFLVLAGLSFSASQAFAVTAPYTATISWTQATQDTNGVALPAGNLTSNTLYRGTKADGSDLAKLKTLNPPATATTDASLGAGTYCYAVTASNAVGESAKSGVVCLTVDAAPLKPKPPSNTIAK